MKKEYKILFLVAILIFSAMLIYKYFHPTDNRFCDDLIIGKTKEDIVKLYGTFDLEDENKCAYNVGTYTDGIFGDEVTYYYVIYFKDLKAYKIELKERYPRGL